ncbi:MAG: response regulator [Acidobacteria bacterium]|nr:response regulator [Acidobacteriota bacterium]
MGENSGLTSNQLAYSQEPRRVLRHELRKPLNSIIGFANVLLKNKSQKLSSTELSYVKRILNNGRQLLSLIDDLLDLTDLESGKLGLKLQAVALDVLLKETIEEIETGEGKVCVALEAPGKVSAFDTDPSRLKQVLKKLIGSGRGEVMVRLYVDPASLKPTRVDVMETDLAPRQLPTISNSFQQVEQGGRLSDGNTTMELSICRSLCDLLGCKLEVQSGPGQGSVFSVIFPVNEGVLLQTRVEEKHPGPSIETPEPAGSKHLMLELKDKTVLIIDEETESRRLLGRYVADFGCRVYSAASGSEGLQMARQHHPDLITLDLAQPARGWEFLKSLKADPGLREIPVVLVSRVAQQLRGVHLRSFDLLDKPVTRHNLLETLKRNLRHGPGRVLIVDDDKDTRELVSAYLSEEKVGIETAVNGREALEVLNRFSPDLVILDLLMPVMDGMTLLSHIRKDSRYIDLPLVVVTAKDVSSREIRHLESETSIILKKGEELEEDLKLILREILKRKK